jgi:hypothetical protein
MRVEAFSLGKKFAQPEANEDSFVSIPGAGYAVIDGVTDRNGTRYAGMLSGQFASRTVKRATERFLIEQQAPRIDPEFAYRGPRAFIDYLTTALHDAYSAEGVLAQAEADWKVRAGCTIIAAIHVEGRIEVIALGDSGIRVNGTDLLQVLKPLDDVTSLLRREAWNFFAALGRPDAECDRFSTSMTWQGTRHQPEGSATAALGVIETIEGRALSACLAHLPNVPESEFIHLIQHGIAHGQGDYQNVTTKALGYGGLDGFHVPDKYIDTRSYVSADVATLELFSDGYFKPGKAFGTASWEEGFREVEAADPNKIGDYPSTKGTTSTQLTDDRTYLGVQLK